MTSRATSSSKDMMASSNVCRRRQGRGRSSTHARASADSAANSPTWSTTECAPRPGPRIFVHVEYMCHLSNLGIVVILTATGRGWHDHLLGNVEYTRKHEAEARVRGKIAKQPTCSAHSSSPPASAPHSHGQIP